MSGKLAHEDSAKEEVDGGLEDLEELLTVVDDLAEEYFYDIRRGLESGELKIDTYEERKKFIDENGSQLQSRNSDGMNLLHLAVNKTSGSSNMRALIRLLIQKYPELMEERDLSGTTPLHTAIYKDNADAVKTMCETVKEIDKILMIKGGRQSESCLHAAVRSNIPVDVTIQLIKRATEQIFFCQDSQGRTPLHVAVEYVRCTDSQLGIVQEILRQCGAALDVADYPQTAFRHINTIWKHSTPTGSRRMRLYRTKNRPAIPPLHNLRTTLYGTRNQEMAVRFLYGYNIEGRKINFEFLNESTTIDPDRFRQGYSNHEYDDMLRYVTLRGDYKVDPQPWADSNDGIGRSDMLFFFQWLKNEKGVRRILKVTVHDDTGQIAHSDEVIQTALPDFDVEILDWCKVDLCPETIYRACRNLRWLRLKWSGNNAVLRAWSEPEGLPRLKQLRRVDLVAQQGLESLHHTRSNMETFRDRLHALRPDINMDITYPRPESGITEGPPIKIGAEYRWLDCMEQLRHMVNFIKKAIKDDPEPVSVALIDDGVDILDAVLLGKIIPGPDHENAPGYGSTTGHGTIMARMILHICPLAKIHFFRIETDRRNVTQVSVKSAVLAINDAVVRNVNIILMPWSISLDSRRNDEVHKDLHKLENVLWDAAHSNIIMFCDQHNDHTSEPSYPAAFDIRSIITIGAFDETTMSAFKASQPDFMFPGNFAEKPKDSVQSQSERKPDSGVASARAAGLAAMILYCAKLAAILERTKGPPRAPRVTEADFEKLQGSSMRDAFTRIGPLQIGELFPVWKIFDPVLVVDSMKSGNDQDVFNILVKIICQLLGK
ncbi:hypothetical protein G7Y89_g8986 [Cudoniella acicularis]|uniref:Peptidase S8/S53 domain-containing protein n=1 Tax=Cudoniella acicularis TaxID=354080 RepID=A0A8H4W312_9HELO|nr:hypothetical protein G7Y89_g8986 [Cudoniella acicularis]